MTNLKIIKNHKFNKKKEIIAKLDCVNKRFNNGILALKNFNIDIYNGDFLTFLGQSGCGKSTIMKLLCGLLKPTSGFVLWPNSTFTNNDKNPVNLSVVFQEPNLLPWLNVFKNVQLPLKLNKIEDINNQRVFECLEMVSLTKFSSLYPNQLSGGMKMRVAIARALVTDPKVLLLDEPFAALDELNRFKLNDELLNIFNEKKLTVIFITHSIYEAVYLSNRIAIISNQPGSVLEEVNLENHNLRQNDYRLTQNYFNKCKVISDKIYNYQKSQK